jgi:hypothetical protein
MVPSEFSSSTPRECPVRRLPGRRHGAWAGRRRGSGQTCVGDGGEVAPGRGQPYEAAGQRHHGVRGREWRPPNISRTSGCPGRATGGRIRRLLFCQDCRGILPSVARSWTGLDTVHRSRKAGVMGSNPIVGFLASCLLIGRFRGRKRAPGRVTLGPCAPAGPVARMAQGVLWPRHRYACT